MVRSGPTTQAGLSGATGSIATPMGRVAVNGDIIIAVNGRSIDAMNDLIMYLETQTLPSDVITLTVLRSGQALQVPATLQPRP